jgi:N-acetylmuramoyl-L-alanine amidase
VLSISGTARGTGKELAEVNAAMFKGGPAAPTRWVAAAVAAFAVAALATACGSPPAPGGHAAPALQAAAVSPPAGPAAAGASPGVPAASPGVPAASPGVPAASPPPPVPSRSRPPGAPPAAPVPASDAGGPGTFGPTGPGLLDGKVVAIDPGHNGRNYADPSFINQLVFNGRGQEACDTTGTETDGGYPESAFNFAVAEDLGADLRAEGATVVLTRTSDSGVGPCITERAAIGNDAHADAAVSIHADGGPASGRGFAILEPVADGINDAIVAPSQRLGRDLRDAFAAGTGEPVSSYDGVDGIQSRDDLAGTNLSTVPKVFVECANMRNATDAALVTSAAWQAAAARAIAAGLGSFLAGR